MLTNIFFDMEQSFITASLVAQTGDLRDTGSISGFGRFPGEGHGYPLQYSCLEKPMDRGAWQATVYEVCSKESDTTEQLTLHIL